MGNNFLKWVLRSATLVLCVEIIRFMAAPGLVTDCLEQRSSGLVFVFYKYWGQRDQEIAIELILFWSFPTGTLENKTVIEPVNRQQGGSVFIVSPSSSPYL